MQEDGPAPEPGGPEDQEAMARLRSQMLARIQRERGGETGASNGSGESVGNGMVDTVSQQTGAADLDNDEDVQMVEDGS